MHYGKNKNTQILEIKVMAHKLRLCWFCEVTDPRTFHRIQKDRIMKRFVLTLAALAGFALFQVDSVQAAPVQTCRGFGRGMNGPCVPGRCDGNFGAYPGQDPYAPYGDSYSRGFDVRLFEDYGGYRNNRFNDDWGYGNGFNDRNFSNNDPGYGWRNRPRFDGGPFGGNLSAPNLPGSDFGYDGGFGDNRFDNRPLRGDRFGYPGPNSYPGFNRSPNGIGSRPGRNDFPDDSGDFLPPTENGPNFNSPNFNSPGFNGSGFNSPGFNPPSFSAPGFNAPGLNGPSINSPGFSTGNGPNGINGFGN